MYGYLIHRLSFHGAKIRQSLRPHSAEKLKSWTDLPNIMKNLGLFRVFRKLGVLRDSRVLSEEPVDDLSDLYRRGHVGRHEA